MGAAVTPEGPEHLGGGAGHVVGLVEKKGASTDERFRAPNYLTARKAPPMFPQKFSTYVECPLALA